MLDLPLVIEDLESPDGHRPFRDWYRGLTREAKVKVDARLQRVRLRNFGDHRMLRNGLVELRIHAGAGLRIYGGIWKGAFFLLAHGGEKSGQASDIDRAMRLWERFTKAAHEQRSKP